MSGRIELPEVPELELAPEKPPQGPMVWMQENLFSTRASTILTLAGLVLAWVAVKGFAGFLFDSLDLMVVGALFLAIGVLTAERRYRENRVVDLSLSVTAILSIGSLGIANSMI